MVWATGTLCSSRSTRMITPASVLGWVMAIGLAANLVLVALGPASPSLGSADIAWMAVAGVSNTSALLLFFTALRYGKVGLVTPIISTEGAVAAVLAVATGEHLGAASAVLLAVIAVGIVLASVAREQRAVPDERKVLSIGLATLAAVLFGIGLFSLAKLGNTLPVGWALLPPRIVGVAAVTIPLLFTRRLIMTRRAVPLVVTSGLTEVIGFVIYIVGARHSLSVTAVIASQLAVIVSVAAYFLFGERLTRLQLWGVATIMVGVATLTAVRAL